MCVFGSFIREAKRSLGIRTPTARLTQPRCNDGERSFYSSDSGKLPRIANPHCVNGISPCATMRTDAISNRQSDRLARGNEPRVQQYIAQLA